MTLTMALVYRMGMIVRVKHRLLRGVSKYSSRGEQAGCNFWATADVIRPSHLSLEVNQLWNLDHMTTIPKGTFSASSHTDTGNEPFNGDSVAIRFLSFRSRPLDS